jgi:hypothetical protein
MPNATSVIYHRHWPRLLKEAIAEGHDPLVFVWDNVEDPRTSEVTYDVYAAAILNWCRTRSEAVYRAVLDKCEGA